MIVLAKPKGVYTKAMDFNQLVELLFFVIPPFHFQMYFEHPSKIMCVKWNQDCHFCVHSNWWCDQTMCQVAIHNNGNMN
jgi:hypothetical protein